MSSFSDANVFFSDEEGEQTKVLDSSNLHRRVSMDDGTASSSDWADEGDVFDEKAMPLFKYSRINGSIHRLPSRDPTTTTRSTALSSPCTSSKIGQFLLPRREDGTVDDYSDLGQQPVLLTGHGDGTVSFVHVETGVAIVDSKQLQVNASSSGPQAAIVDVSLDASANYLAAINVTGCCAIWEVRYGTTSTSETPTQEPEQDNVFKSFLTNLAGQSNANNNNNIAEATPSFKSTSVQVSRITYPSSFGQPKCLVLDPCYKRRREKSLLVAFADGRLILTKRGFVFQRRNDATIYQATAGDSIEALTWRGTLVAWADASGIKLFDVESMTRIAHIDRPAGARASLYPTISDLRPSLCFETSNTLLVAWGDCVMTMSIQETVVRQAASPDVSGSSIMASGSSHAAEVATTIVKRRQVECTMAWQLDCVACGVAPLDKDHLVILGLIPNDDQECETTDILNDLELQIISRSEGSVTYADALPVVKFPTQFTKTHGGRWQESASDYTILSSFAMPRLEDNMEAEEEGITPDQDFDFTLFASNANKASFIDSHLRWNLNSIEFDGKSNEDSKSTEDKADDDSDDYGFILRQTSSIPSDSVLRGSLAPLMVVATRADLVLIRTSDVDDAIAHALALHKVGLALQRALRHKRKVRRHDMNSLVDAFLRTVLCIGDEGNNEQQQKLSIRRLELAAKSTPVLLGGSVQRWELWVNEFARIPGALFVLCDQLPVRDPKLPQELYEEVLKSLFSEIEEMLKPKVDGTEVSAYLIEQAVGRFLGALCAWGPTHALREKIQFHQYFLDKQNQKLGIEIHDDALQRIESALQRRLTQSAATYLQLPSALPAQSKNQTSGSSTSISVPSIADSSTDCLFQIKQVLSKVSLRVPILGDNKLNSLASEHLLNTKVALDALAELYVMLTRYDSALRCYLVIGSLFSPEPLSVLEKNAIQIVNHPESAIRYDNAKLYHRYGFVLAMIEHHHLHGLLLDAELLEKTKSEGKLSRPLISLLALLGLDVVGDFLIEHCIPPPDRVKYDGSASSVNSADSDASRATRDGDETLPINYVAEQLRSSPPLLHWYLHLIFTRRPEMYIQFPTTAVPPRAITELHRAHLDLYVDFAEDKDSALSLVGTEVYNQEQKTTPLLLFLKAALPLGGIRPDEVRRLLETKRSENIEDVTEFPHSFAIELAHVIENYGDGTEEDSQEVLNLYLKGAKSVMLAAAYAQRNNECAQILWETLIEYCLSGGEPCGDQEMEPSKVDGTLFGSLLEAAALCGADLALLVTSIPEGMNIEGLRPRLVAAVADYRMKLTMHEAAAEICVSDRISLLRELGHRSRRGLRQSNSPVSAGKSYSEQIVDSQLMLGDQPKKPLRRPVERPSRYRLSVRLPMR